MWGLSGKNDGQSPGICVCRGKKNCVLCNVVWKINLSENYEKIVKAVFISDVTPNSSN